MGQVGLLQSKHLHIEIIIIILLLLLTASGLSPGGHSPTFRYRIDKYWNVKFCIQWWGHGVIETEGKITTVFN
jgi:hypothetical protein